jgi:hypothetical protein
MLRRVALVRTDVSEELSASFIRVTRIGELGTALTCCKFRSPEVTCGTITSPCIYAFKLNLSSLQDGDALSASSSSRIPSHPSPFQPCTSFRVGGEERRGRNRRPLAAHASSRQIHKYYSHMRLFLSHLLHKYWECHVFILSFGLRYWAAVKDDIGAMLRGEPDFRFSLPN